MENLNLCVNCSASGVCGQKVATNYDIPIDLQEDNVGCSQVKTVQVKEVLCTIYKLNSLNQIEFNENPFLSSNMGVCEVCYEILINLFKFYNKFNQIRVENSRLSVAIFKVENLVHRPDSCDQNQPIKVENNDSDFNDQEQDDFNCNYSPSSSQSRMELNDNSNEFETVGTKRRSKRKIKINSLYRKQDDNNFYCQSDLDRPEENVETCSENSDSEYLPVPIKQKKRTKEVSSRKEIEIISSDLCPVCQKSFKTSSNSTLISHLLSHLSPSKDRGPSPCPIPNCTTKIHKQKSWLEHFDRHISDTHHICPVTSCRKSFYLEREKVRHLKLHLNENIFICPICDLFCDSNDQLINHKATIHQKVLECPVCPSKVFESEIQLQNHVNSDHQGEKLFNCPRCSSSFKFLRYFRLHFQIHHAQKYYQCSRGCLSHFKTMERRQRHEETCKAQPNYKCSFCGKTFKEKRYMEKHEQIHQGQSFKCQFDGCDKTFFSTSTIQRHQKMQHENIRPFICEHCGSSFRKEYQLKHHSLVHSDVKSFLCPNCGKTFKRKTGLNAHMKIHTDK